MSLRDRLREGRGAGAMFDRFGVLANPFPASNRTSGNPRFAREADKEAEDRIVAFFRNGTSQVVVVEGRQGVGKTNFLNRFESEIHDALSGLPGYYIVRYFPDPETLFEGAPRRLFEELGTDHLYRLADSLKEAGTHIEEARGHDMRTALRSLGANRNVAETMMEWLLGLRLLKIHRQELGVQFRLDTVESKTAALRDMVQVSARAGVLNGTFLLLDELEKQDGVLGPRAVVRYLSALRAVVDALPQRLFMMIAITPEALRRYSAVLPALRGRLQQRIELAPLTSEREALELAKFYMDTARRKASEKMDRSVTGDAREIVRATDIEEIYGKLKRRAGQRGDDGVRQRQFLHELHMRAENAMQGIARIG